MALKPIERYMQVNRRLVDWNMNAYVPWARRHEPYSFAIGPLILGGGVVVFWLGFGLDLPKALLYFLVPVVALFIVSISTGLWVRRQRERSKSD